MSTFKGSGLCKAALTHPFINFMPCHCPSWMSPISVLSGSSGPEGPGHPLGPITTAPEPLYHIGNDGHILSNSTSLSLRTVAEYQGQGGGCWPFHEVSLLPQSQGLGSSISCLPFHFVFRCQCWVSEWSIVQELATALRFSACNPESLNWIEFWKLMEHLPTVLCTMLRNNSNNNFKKSKLALTESVLCARLWAKPFTYIMTFSPHKNLMRENQLWSLAHRSRKWSEND